MGKMRKVLALVLASAILATTLASCGKKETGKTTSGVEQVVRYNLAADPATIDPALNNAVESATVLSNAFEGLMRLDKNDKPVPGVAKEYKMSDDGLTYTFTLREDAKWSDGEKVTAKDFAYAWTRALDPTTAAEYAYQMYYIKNGAAFNSGKATKDQLGIKVVDDYTLEVTLEAPTAYFLSLMTFPTYFPVREDIVSKDPNWALNMDTYVSNGPFKMTGWSPKESMTFEKNDNYWNKGEVTLDKIVYSMISDENTYLTSFRNGELDMIESPPQAEIQGLLADGTAQSTKYLGTYYYCINVSDSIKQLNPEGAAALLNPKVRKALSLAIDRTQIVEKVAQGGQKPATSFVPAGVVDSKGDEFQKDYLSPSADVEAAKKLLAEAGYPNGQGLPVFEITFNTSAGHQSIAEAIQDMWKTNLGIQVTLKNEEWKVFQQTRQDKQYQIARHGWIADYNDPMTFLDLFVSGSGNNDAGYSNPQYDKYIDSAKKETDDAKRTEYLEKAEALLLEEMPIIPIYYNSNIVCINPKVTGIVKSPLGFVFFDKAVVAE